MSQVAAAVAEFNVMLVGLERITGEAPKIRTVRLTDKQGFDIGMLDPDNQAYRNPVILLDLIYKYGQNDFQPRNCRSVSVGDIIVIRMNGEDTVDCFYLVEPIGFRMIRRIRY